MTPPNTDDPRVGETLLGRYTVTGVLGRGAMSVVYEAEQPMGRVSRRVAVKVLRSELASDPEVTARFERECLLVTQLHHPNTITFHDFGTLADGTMIIVMELVEGESLAARLDRDGFIPLTEALHVLRQIGSALAEAHKLGIVHRDLKPDNVVLGQRVKVLDFGIAKQLGAGGETITGEGIIVGTPAYMSPEQLQGLEVDSRADVYSLAILAYEMITGELPWDEPGDIYGWMVKHLDEPPTPIEAHAAGAELVPEARAMLMQGLAKAPEDRPGNVGQFVRTVCMQADRRARPRGDEPEDPKRSVKKAKKRRKQRPSAVTVDETAPTPPAIETLPSSASRLPTNLPMTALGLLVLAGFLFLGLIALGAPVAQRIDPRAHERPLERRADQLKTDLAQPKGGDEAMSVADGEAPAPPPTEWLRLVQEESRVASAGNALGEPDERTAWIRRGGSLTLELPAGTLIGTDDGPEPDLVVVANRARNASYRVDIGLAFGEFVVVREDVVGRLELDLDAFSLASPRYVRLVSDAPNGARVDAVGVHRVTLAAP